MYQVFVTLIWRLTASSVMQGESILTESNWTKARAPFRAGLPTLTEILRLMLCLFIKHLPTIGPLKIQKTSSAMTLQLWPAILGSLAVFLNSRKRKGIVPLSWSWNSNMGLFHLKGPRLVWVLQSLGTTIFGACLLWGGNLLESD